MNKIKLRLLWLAPVLIFLVALAFRLYKIHTLPGGLFPDEAANGLDINLMEQGILQPFYERGNGREALFFYLLWGSVKVFGRSPFAHHLVSALVGSLAVLACYLVTKQLFKWRDSPTVTQIHGRALMSQFAIPLLAGFLLATSSWHLVLSRTAFRANLIPLLSALTLWAMLKVMYIKRGDKNRWLYPLLLGAFFALGFYTYIAFRIMVPLMGILILWPALAYIKQHGLKTLIKTFYKPVCLALISFLIVFAPLGRYFYTHPGSFVGRSGQVSVFNPELNGGNLVGTIFDVSKKSLTAYFADGDLNWRHNISGFPFLSPLVSPFFALGLILCIVFAIRYFLFPIRYSRNYPEFLLTGWFFAMLLPVITTAEGIPHGLRAIGTIPAVFIITAFGMYAVYTWTKKYTPRLTTHYSLLTTFLLLVLPLQTYQLYFVRAANDHEYQYSFRSDLTVVSEYLKQHGNRETTYLILDKFSVQTVDYLTTVNGKTSCDRDPHYQPKTCVDNPINKPYIQVDPERAWMPENAIYENKPVWPNGLETGDEIVFTQSSLFDIKKFKEYHSNVKLKLFEQDHIGRYVMAVYVME